MLMCCIRQESVAMKACKKETFPRHSSKKNQELIRALEAPSAWAVYVK